MFYRRDLLAQAGFAAPPRSWLEWQQMLAAIKERAGPDRYSILLPLNEFEPLLVLALQQNEPLLRDDGRFGNFESAGFRRTLQFYVEMFRRGWAPPLTNADVSNVWSEFARGYFSFYVTGPWNIGEFKRRLPPERQESWMTAPLPGPDGPGASIAGVALSFGAQNLVRDFLAGIFVLLEDQYGVGDVIDAGPATGRVEAVSLRSTQLRDLHGTLWHVPNGQVSRVGNFSQGWAQAVLDVEVDEGADIAESEAVIRQAADLSGDPTLGPRIQGEPQVWGVERISDGAVAIRLVVRTSPRARWRVERELRARVKAALQEHDVPLKAVC